MREKVEYESRDDNSKKLCEKIIPNRSYGNSHLRGECISEETYKRHLFKYHLNRHFCAQQWHLQMPTVFQMTIHQIKTNKFNSIISKCQIKWWLQFTLRSFSVLINEWDWSEIEEWMEVDYVELNCDFISWFGHKCPWNFFHDYDTSNKRNKVDWLGWEI